MVILSKIYTRTGDHGSTRLVDNSVTAKSDLRVEAYGLIDQANASIGLAIALDTTTKVLSREVREALGIIQNELFDLGADLATPLDPPPTWEALRIVESQTERLESEIDWMNESLKALDSFILPGGSPLSAHLHLARTVCRRAERLAVALMETGEAVNPEAVKYLNRLSDHLFVAARRANANGAADVKWKPGATR